MNIKHDIEKVIQTGLQLFCVKGYNPLGVDEICKQTGMTKGAFYHAFKSKEQFLIEAIHAYSQKNIERIQKELSLDPDASPLQRLLSFYTKMLNAQPKNKYTGCFINNIMSELGSISEAVDQSSEQSFNAFLEAIEPTVKKAQLKKELTSQISSKAITELLHTTFYGVLTRIKSSKDVNAGIKTIQLLIHQLNPQHKNEKNNHPQKGHRRRST